MAHSTKDWLLYLVLARSCTLAHFQSFWKSFRHATFKIYLAQRSQSRLFCSRQNATRSNLLPFLSFHFLLLLYSFLFLFTTFESFFPFLFFFISLHSSFSEFPALQNVDPTYLEYFENLHLCNKTNFNLYEYLNHKQLYLHSSVSFASNTLTKLMTLRNTR